MSLHSVQFARDYAVGWAAIITARSHLLVLSLKRFQSHLQLPLCVLQHALEALDLLLVLHGVEEVGAVLNCPFLPGLHGSCGEDQHVRQAGTAVNSLHKACTGAAVTGIFSTAANGVTVVIQGSKVVDLSGCIPGFSRITVA